MKSILISVKYIFIALSVYILYLLGITTLFTILGDPTYQIHFHSFQWVDSITLLTTVVIAPIWEESVFRFAPLEIAKNTNVKFLFPIMILSSFCFGWLHGAGMFSIIHQGILGLFQCFLYNKRGYGAVVASHSIWNLLCNLFVS